CGAGGFDAFVASFGAGALDGLFDGVDSEHAEGDGNTGVERYLRQTLGAFAGDIIKMRRAAANHSAPGDDGVVAFGSRNWLRNQLKLKGAGIVVDGDVFIFDAVTTHGVQRAIFQTLHHKTVPTTHNQRVLALARREVAFNYFNTHLILTFFRTNALSISEIKSVSPPRQRLECQVTSETL